MNFNELARKRYTTKKYIPNKIIPKKDLDFILEAARLGPTALGMDPVRVLVFQNQDAKENIVPFFLNNNTSKVSEASVVIIFIGQSGSALFKNDNELLKKNMPYQDFNDEKSKAKIITLSEWYGDKSTRYDTLDIIVAANKSTYLTLAAADLGYGSTIMTGIAFDNFEKYLKDKKLIVDGERIVLAVAIGYTDENDELNNSIKNNKKRAAIDTFVKEVK